MIPVRTLASLIVGAAFLSSTLPGQSVNGRAVATGANQSTESAARVVGLRAIIDLNLKGVSVEQAIKTIARDAGLRVSFSEEVYSVKKNITIKSKAIIVERALAQVLSGTGISYRTVEGGQLLFGSAPSKSQAVPSVISGKATDSKTGKGISGVKVSASTGEQATSTGEDGGYSLTIFGIGTHTITARLVGYAKQSRNIITEGSSILTVNFKLEPSANVLDQVVVTGTIVQTELKAVPNAITVITAKDIEERGISRVDQLFRGEIPGLFVLNNSSSNPLDSVAMYSRGATMLANGHASASIKTYVDGVELANGAFLSQIDPRSIERIEILTGPQASTIYGSNAINGVMQVFTKRGHTPKPQFTVNLTSGLIQNSLSSAMTPMHTYDGQVAGTEGRLAYSVGGSWDYLGAWTPGKQTQRLGSFGSAHAQLPKFTVDASARTGRTLNEQRGPAPQINVVRRMTGEWSIIGNLTVVTPTTMLLKGQTTGLSVGITPVSWWSQQLTLGNDIQDSESLSRALGYSTTRDTTLSLTKSTSTRTSGQYTTNVQLPVGTIGNVALIIGGDLSNWRLNTLSGSSATSLSGSLTGAQVTRSKPVKTKGSFLQGQLGLYNSLFLTYGLRAEWNAGYGEEEQPNITPRYGIALSRDFHSVTAKLRASYGRSTRPPAVGLRNDQPATYAPYLALFGPHLLYGVANEELGPEYQQGGEGGIELYFGSRASLVVTRYNQTVDGLISLIPNVDSMPSLQLNDPGCIDQGYVIQPNGYCYLAQYQYINVGAIRNQGWELQTQTSLGPIAAKATYSWTKSRVIGITPKYRSILTETQYQPGRTPNYFPEHTLAGQISYSGASTLVALNINRIGPLFSSFGGESEARMNQLLNRAQSNLWRYGTPSGWRAPRKGYATADLNASKRFSPRLEGILQVQNLADFYHTDYNAGFATIGRQTRAGVRLRFN